VSFLRRWEEVSGWSAFLIPLLVFVLTLNGRASTSGVDAAITGTQYALWKYGTFSLGIPQHLLASTMDYGVYHGQAYSAIAPGMALLSFPFAAVGFAAGISPRVADELFLSLVASAAVCFVYRISRLYAGANVSLLVALAMAFGTPVWPFTSVVFENVLSMTLVVMAVYCVLKAPSTPSRLGSPLLAGFLLGLASFVEYAAALFVVPLAVFTWNRSRALRGSALLVLSFLVGPALHAAYDFALFGNPLTTPEQLKTGASKPLVGILSSFNLWSAPAHVLLYLIGPYRGMLFLCPIMLLGLVAFTLNWGLKQFRAESLLFLTLAVLVLVFYSAWSDWAGGLCYGPRFLTVATPFMLIPLAPYLDRNRTRKEWALFFGLTVYSSFIQGAGAMTTAYSVGGGLWTFQPLAFNLPHLLDSNLGLWWLASNGPETAWLGYLTAGMVFLLIWATIFLIIWSTRTKCMPDVREGSSQPERMLVRAQWDSPQIGQENEFRQDSFILPRSSMNLGSCLAAFDVGHLHVTGRVASRAS
jgi:hypothetical protein